MLIGSSRHKTTRASFRHDVGGFLSELVPRPNVGTRNDDHTILLLARNKRKIGGKTDGGDRTS